TSQGTHDARDLLLACHYADGVLVPGQALQVGATGAPVHGYVVVQAVGAEEDRRDVADHALGPQRVQLLLLDVAGPVHVAVRVRYADAEQRDVGGRGQRSGPGDSALAEHRRLGVRVVEVRRDGQQVRAGGVVVGERCHDVRCVRDAHAAVTRTVHLYDPAVLERFRDEAPGQQG